MVVCSSNGMKSLMAVCSSNGMKSIFIIIIILLSEMSLNSMI